MCTKILANSTSEIVYILGEEVNDIIVDWHGISPPSPNNFFNVALKIERFSDYNYVENMKDVYDYIEEHCEKTIEDLAKYPFNIKMCLNLLEHQAYQAFIKGKNADYIKSIAILIKLKTFLADVFYYFEHFAYASDTMRHLGKILYYEKPTIITLNYDCILEYILEATWGSNLQIPARALKERELSDELLVYSHSKWNRRLGYGYKFDEIQFQQAGVTRFVKGTRFYSYKENQIYTHPILKLYGSINWFRYVPILSSSRSLKLKPELEANIILKNGTWWFEMAPEHNGWLLDPIIITPSLYEKRYHNMKPFKDIWETAKNILSQSEKTVIINLSLTPNDHSTRRLLSEAFQDSNLKKLIIINPDNNEAEILKELCHFKGDVLWFSNLDEYFTSIRGFQIQHGE